MGDAPSSKDAIKSALEKNDSPATINIGGLALDPVTYHAAYNASRAAEDDALPSEPKMQSTGPAVEAQKVLRAKFGEQPTGDVKDRRILDAADAIASHARAVAAANGAPHYDRDSNYDGTDYSNGGRN